MRNMGRSKSGRETSSSVGAMPRCSTMLSLREFEENDSELETAARKAIAEDFERIATAYGFDADIEELIAPRDW
jgi:hypothetical protein